MRYTFWFVDIRLSPEHPYLDKYKNEIELDDNRAGFQKESRISRESRACKGMEQIV